MRLTGRSKAAAWRNVPLLVLAVGIGGWATYQGQRLIRADLLSAGTRKQVSAWVSGAAVPGSQQDWDEALVTLTAAQAITPDSPSLQESLGDLHMVAGRRNWDEVPLRLHHFNQAVAQYRMALALRPTDPQTWASLAAAYQGAGETGEIVRQAWSKALELGPNEGHVQPMLLETLFATWSSATPEMQTWAKAFFEASAEPQRKAINTMARRYGLRFDVDVPAPTAPAVSTPARPPPS